MEHQHEAFVIDPAGGDISGESKRIRERGPATLVELPGQVVAWMVTDHALLKQLLTDSNVSKNPNLHWPAWRSGQIPADWPLALWVGVPNMFTAYGTEHRRLRTLVSSAFTARRTADLRPRIQEITTELLDDIAATPATEPVDLREELAYPLPIRVICELFGVPESQRDELRRITEALFDTTATPEEVQAIDRDLYTILNDLVAAKRDTPSDDMTSGLIAAHDEDGSRLSEQELVYTLSLMLVAGHETTVNLITNAVHALLIHPDQYERIQAGESTWSDVIDETLRWAPSVARLPLRYAVDDITLDGVTIKKGDAILADYGAAGRDPAHHGADADQFDLSRPSRGDHLAFGHGVNFCLGAPLARLEAGIALPALFSLFPDLTLAVPPGELKPLTSFIANSYSSLPVHLNREGLGLGVAKSRART
ncbi:MAG: cytochrome P450 family protein [Actinomadura sp.]